jgi:DNA-binding NarL/FixJ family response regulator
MTPEETHVMIIEETDESIVNITLLNVAVEGNNTATALRELRKNDPSAIIALLIPVHMADHDVIVEAVMAGAKAYIKKPASGTAIKRRAANNLIRSEGK